MPPATAALYQRTGCSNAIIVGAAPTPVARRCHRHLLLASPACRHAAPPNSSSGGVQLWIDTCGHAATYPILRLAGARVAAYVHYPTISSDMLSRVRRRDATYNNSAAISASATVSFLKLLYYVAFAGLYGWLGGFANVAMVNSSWTGGHVETIWWGAQRRRPPVVWPPCDVTKFSTLPLKRPLTQHCLVSVAQFRPEKNHECVARCLACMLRVPRRLCTCRHVLRMTRMRVHLDAQRTTPAALVLSDRRWPQAWITSDCTHGKVIRGRCTCQPLAQQIVTPPAFPHHCRNDPGMQASAARAGGGEAAAAGAGRVCAPPQARRHRRLPP